MNTFITFALFALCATVAQGQIVSGLGGFPYGLYSDIVSQNSGSSGASSSASSSASSTAANNGVTTSRLASGPAYPAVGFPYYGQGYPASLAAPFVAPYGAYPAPLGAYPAPLGAYPAPLGAYPAINAYGAGIF